MKKKSFLVLLMTNLILSGLVFAKVETFNLFKKKVSLSVPTKWTTITKEIATPLKLIGPQKEGLRPVITVTPMKLGSKKLSFDDNKNAETSYKRSRMQWLQKFGAKVIEFYPSKRFKAKKNEYYQFSYAYEFNNQNYMEKSYYVKCKKHVYHLKSVVPLKDSEFWKTTTNSIIESFDCKF